MAILCTPLCPAEHLARHGVALAFCFAHAGASPWRFHKTTARIAADVVETLARFYAIESRIRGSSAKLFGDEADPGPTSWKGMEILAPLL